MAWVSVKRVPEPDLVPYSTITDSPITGVIGAEITGIVLTQDVLPAVFEELNSALLDYEVIFLRDQDISPAQQVALARAFGPVEAHHYFTNGEDHPEISVILPDPDRPPDNLWHTDGSSNSNPPMGAVLHAQEVPGYGGDTLWSSLTAAYDGLSDRMKTFLEGLTARHDWLSTYEEFYLKQEGGAEKLAERRAENPPAIHPVVRTHPVTGKRALYINPNYVTEIVGLPRHESDAPLAMLFAHETQPEYRLRFTGTNKTIAIWDNRVTMHYPVFDYGDKRRKMHRIAITGEVPF